MRFVQKQRPRPRAERDQYEQPWPLPRLDTTAEADVTEIDEVLGDGVG
jgi:hypothetical protein